MADSIVGFDEKHARGVVEANPVADVIRGLTEKGQLALESRYMRTMASAAFVYDYTGEERYFEVAITSWYKELGK